MAPLFIAHASPVAAPDLKGLVAQSDRVIVASILAVNDTENDNKISPSTHRTAELSVLRSLAGGLLIGDRISVGWTETGLKKAKTGLIGESGLWFLKLDSTGRFSPLPLTSTSSSIDAVRLAVPKKLGFLADGSKLTSVELALREILNAAENGPEAAGQYSYLDYGAYDDLSPVLRREFYSRLAQSPIELKSARGLAGLVRLDDVQALRRIETKFRTLTPFLDLIGFAISSRYRNTDPTGLAILNRFASSAQAPKSFQIAAAEAIAFIHTADSVPYVEALLNSGEAQRELLGAAGLAMYANGVKPVLPGSSAGFMPSGVRGPFATEETMRNFTMDPARFTQNRSQLLTFWKSWLATNRNQILKTP